MGASRWSCTGLDRSQGIQKHESINHHEQIQQIIKKNKSSHKRKAQNNEVASYNIKCLWSPSSTIPPFSEHIDYSPNESI